MKRVGRTLLSAKSRGASNSAKPLASTLVLVGRARHQAGSLSAELRKLGADVLEIPFIEIRKPRSFHPLDTALKNLASYDWLILTSVNGVEAMWERFGKLRLTKKSLANLEIAAIGPATRKAIEKRGGRVNVVPKEYVAESVVKSLRRRVKGKRILLVRAKVARDVIPNELREAGAHVDVVEAYTKDDRTKSSRTRCRPPRIESAVRCHHVHQFVDGKDLRRFTGHACKTSGIAGKNDPGLDRAGNVGYVAGTWPWGRCGSQAIHDPGIGERDRGQPNVAPFLATSV